MRPHLTSWPAPHVRRGFKRLYLVIALPWLLILAIPFALATYEYVYSDAEFTRLDAKITAAAAHDPDAPASDELLRDSDNLSGARVRRDQAEVQMAKFATDGIAPALLVFHGLARVHLGRISFRTETEGWVNSGDHPSSGL